MLLRELPSLTAGLLTLVKQQSSDGCSLPVLSYVEQAASLFLNEKQAGSLFYKPEEKQA